MRYFPEQAIITLAVCLIHTALLAYLLLRYQYRKRAGFAVLASYLALTVFWDFLLFSQASPFFVLPAWLSQELTALYPLSLMAGLVWYFTDQFLEGKKYPWLALGVIVGATIIVWLLGSNWVTVPAIQIDLPPTWVNVAQIELNNQSIARWLTLITPLFFLSVAITSAIRVQQGTHSPRHRNRIQILLVGLLLITIGLGLYVTQVPLLQNMGLIIQWLGAPILIVIVLKQNLPHINTGLKEFVNFSVIMLVTLMFYGSIIYGLQTLLGGQPNSELLIAIVAAVLLAIFYLPLRRLTVNFIEFALFGHRHNEEQIIKDYIETTNNILFIQELVAVSLTFIDRKLNIKRGALFLLDGVEGNQYQFSILSNLSDELPSQIRINKNTLLTRELIDRGRSMAQYNLDLFPKFKEQDPEGWQALKDMAFEQYVPIQRNHILVGIIALGSFSSGVPYSVRNLELFSTLATQTAIALENARLFDSVRQNLEEITSIKDVMGNVFASIQSGVITADNSDKVLMINEAAYTILNLGSEIRIGVNINAIMKSLNDTALPALFRDVKATQRSYHGYEISARVKDRGNIHLSVDLTPLRNSQKRVEGVAIVINDLTETSRLQATQDMFRTYLSPAVVDRLPSDPTQLRLGGQRQEVSILFADIRGFTTFSEFLSPEDLITVLNEYLSMAAEAILVYEGTLDKFMGDAIMAIFNAPLSQPDHPLRAVKAAAAIQRRLAEHHRRLGHKAPSLQFGIGIHVGEAVVGNVGTNSRMDYTAIGDAVNLAKRIQENTPGGKVLLSQHTFDLVQGQVNALPFADLKVKGRQEPEQVYELLNIFSTPVDNLAEVKVTPNS